MEAMAASWERRVRAKARAAALEWAGWRRLHDASILLPPRVRAALRRRREKAQLAHAEEGASIAPESFGGWHDSICVSGHSISLYRRQKRNQLACLDNARDNFRRSP
jgi:hypothetical protein